MHLIKAKNMKQNIIIAIVVAVILAGITFWFVGRNQATAPEVTNTPESAIIEGEQEDEFVGDVPGDQPDPSTIPSTATVAVSTQVPGDSVTIDNVFLEKPGFVVIHESTASGQAGKIIGTSGLLGTGARQDLEISAMLKPGAKYFAMLHEDNGDKVFKADTDKAITNNNIVVMTMFSVSQ